MRLLLVKPQHQPHPHRAFFRAFSARKVRLVAARPASPEQQIQLEARLRIPAVVRQIHWFRHQVRDVRLYLRQQRLQLLRQLDAVAKAVTLCRRARWESPNFPIRFLQFMAAPGRELRCFATRI